MRISDWSSDVCSSDLGAGRALSGALASGEAAQERVDLVLDLVEVDGGHLNAVAPAPLGLVQGQVGVVQDVLDTVAGRGERSEGRCVGKECVSTCKSMWSP